MAVTDLLISLEDFEPPGATYNNIGSGGGATDNTDVFIEGTQSGGRRCDNATEKGFMATIGSTDLSTTNAHVKIWVYCFHWTAVTSLTARIASGAAAYDDHTYPVADIPNLGGWIPLWVDVSRTPDRTGTSGLNEAAVTDVGVYLNIGNVGGAGDNFIIDEIVWGQSGYRWDGTGGSFADFRTAEVTNVGGVFLPSFDADLCFARLEIGSATATGFTDTGFTIVFPDQVLVATDFMGITCDLQSASTTIDLSNGALVSGSPAAATRRPDFRVTGLAGNLLVDTVLFNGLRTIELNDACQFTNCVVLNTGVVDATNTGTLGPDCSGTVIVDSTVGHDASSFVWNVAADPDGQTDNMSFSKGTNDHHAIELGTASNTSVTFRGLTSTGFSATDASTSSFFYVARSTGNVTINVIGGSGNFTYKSAGATVTVVLDPVTTTIVVRDENDAVYQGARVLATASDGTGPFPFQLSITNLVRSGSTATATAASHGLSNGDKVQIKGAANQEYNGVYTISNVTTNTFDYTVTGTPASPDTGSPNVTGVVVEGLTDVNGEVSASRTFSADQPIRVKVRKATSAPFYKPINATDTVDSVNGLTKTVQLQRDD